MNDKYSVETLASGQRIVNLLDCPGYYINEEGRLWNPVRATTTLPAFDKTKGARIAEIVYYGKRYRYRVPHVLALLMDKPEGNNLRIAHKDGDKKNVTLANLFWEDYTYALTQDCALASSMDYFYDKAVLRRISDGLSPASKLAVVELIRYYPRLVKSLELTDAVVDSLLAKYTETISIIKENPKKNDTVRKILYKGAYRRSIDSGIPFTITGEDITLPRVCPYFGIQLVYGGTIATKASPSLDRIVPSLGYVPGNVQVISYLANNMKSAANPDELLAFAKGCLALHGN